MGVSMYCHFRTVFPKVKETAENVDEAVQELPYANSKPEDLWRNHSKVVQPKPHGKDNPSWKAIQKMPFIALGQRADYSQTYLGCMKKGPVFTDPKLKWCAHLKLDIWLV